MTNNEFPYYKINHLSQRWSQKDGARVVPKARLSTDKAPPAPPEQFTFPEYFPPKKTAEDFLNDLEKIQSKFRRFKRWLDAPAPPKNKGKFETAPPFDIQEIPAAMRKEGMPIAAKLMERWFAGQLNYSPTDSDEKALINQDGQPYPETMFEKNVVTLEWILKFERARVEYEHLISAGIRTPNALKKIKEKLSFYGNCSLHPLETLGGDLMELHNFFQFQFAGVDGSLSQKIWTQMKAAAERFGVPDDLSGALGSFNFYAAIASGEIYREWDKSIDSFRKEKMAKITGVWVYVKDNYTFADLPGNPSQYLGHWGNSGVIVMPMDAVASVVNHTPYTDSPIPHLDFAVTTGKSTVKSELYYPVRNKNFRDWAINHQHGGDFVILTKPKYVPVYPPIVIML